MKILGIIDEDIVNYKKCSMYIAFPYCTFKCGKENCQNKELENAPLIDVGVEEVCERYLNNPITEAIVFGGLEPLDSGFEIMELIDHLRRIHACEDDIVVYTGYTEDELNNPEFTKLNALYKNICKYPNIIIKFGRYIPNQEPHFDKVLGINLISNNQYGKRVS